MRGLIYATRHCYTGLKKMALLAESKRKTKYGLDPRNTNWSNDESKFGQRLMEKMGWEKGKGLGAGESGMTEHIKANYKSDTRGLGCTPKEADAWIAHQDDFNDLLKALNSEHGAGEETKPTNPQNDGQKRYYGRFARGRVQTLRSTEDLDCIFGKRKAGSAPDSPASQSANGSDEESKDENSHHGLQTVTSTSSVQEYFAQKMAEMKRAKGSDLTVTEGKDEDGGKSTETSAVKDKSPPVFGAVGFSYDDDKVASLDCDTKLSEVNEKRKKKRSKRRSKPEESDLNIPAECSSDKAPDNLDQLNDTCSEGQKLKSKKKKKKNSEKDEIPTESRSEIIEQSDATPAMTSDTDTMVEELPGKKSKKSKRKSAEDVENNPQEVELERSGRESTTGDADSNVHSPGDTAVGPKSKEIKKTSSKKQKKMSETESNEYEGDDCKQNEDKSKTKKSKKRKVDSENHMESEVLVTEPRKKRKRSRCEPEEAVTEEVSNKKKAKSETECNIEESGSSQPNKKKKKERNNKLVDDEGFCVGASPSAESTTKSNGKPKKRVKFSLPDEDEDIKLEESSVSKLNTKVEKRAKKSKKQKTQEHSEPLKDQAATLESDEGKAGEKDKQQTKEKRKGTKKQKGTKKTAGKNHEEVTKMIEEQGFQGSNLGSIQGYAMT